MNTNYKVKPVNHNPQRSDEPIWWGYLVLAVAVRDDHTNHYSSAGYLDANGHHRCGRNGTDMSQVACRHYRCTVHHRYAGAPKLGAMLNLHHGMHDLKFHVGVAGKVGCYFVAGLISARYYCFSSL